jgi:hypothetical protein
VFRKTPSAPGFAGGLNCELLLAQIGLSDEQDTGDIHERRSPELYQELVELRNPSHP